MNEPNQKPTGKEITIGPDGKKVYPQGTIFTRVKFTKSERTGQPIGFISQNPVNKMYNGVREDSKFPKSVCIVDAKLIPEIILGVLYKVAVVPMHNKHGFIVIEAEPYQFKATIEQCYVPKACYVLEVKFGNQVIRFDPKDGKKDSMRTISGCRALLEKRMDIANLADIVDEFISAASDLVEKYRRDGFYYKAS